MNNNGLGSTLTVNGVHEDKSGEYFNNPFTLVPATGQLVKQTSATFLTIGGKLGLFNISKYTLFKLIICSPRFHETRKSPKYT